MNYWIDEQIARERHLDMLDEERRRRVAAIVAVARRRVARQNARFYNPVLARLGRWLVAWGCSLETRYGPIAEPQIVTSTGGSTTR